MKSEAHVETVRGFVNVREWISEPTGVEGDKSCEPSFPERLIDQGEFLTVRHSPVKYQLHATHRKGIMRFLLQGDSWHGYSKTRKKNEWHIAFDGRVKRTA
jgi:hypothetical protein